MKKLHYYKCCFCFSLFEEPQIKEREVFNVTDYRKYKEEVCPNCGGYHIIEKQGDIVMDRLLEGCD